MIFAAGDLTDPHGKFKINLCVIKIKILKKGTHRTCLVAVVRALEKAEKEMPEWRSKTEVYLYRGAW